MEHFYKNIIILLESCILLFFNSLAYKRETYKVLSAPRTTKGYIENDLTVIDHETFTIS